TGYQQMTVSPADHRLAPLLGKFENAIVLLARPHPVYFQCMDRPAVPGKQIRGRNRLCSRPPRDERMVQDDQAAAGREDLEQLVVAPVSCGRLNLRVYPLNSALGQMTNSQVKQVSLKPQ